MEAGYTPDGYLGALCRGDFFYDFSDPENFEEVWIRLKDHLNEIQAAEDRCNTGLQVEFHRDL